MDTVYSRLSRVPIIKYNYSLKFLFVAFIGIHIPLIGLAVYALNSSQSLFSGTAIIIVTLIFTLLSTGVTLFVLKKLLAPLLMSDKALKDYISNGTIPDLPTHYEDEAGKLMVLIQDTIKHLDKLANEKQEITTLVSHNLRTPLSQIISLCELIKVDDLNLNEYVDKIESVTRLQLQNLTDLLTQMMETGTQIIALPDVPYNLNGFINEELQTVIDSLETKSLSISLNLAEEELLINKNRSNLSLVFQNLLSNAIKFSYTDGKISIYTRNINGKMEIEVADEGLGFSENYQKNLFKDARNTGRKGTKNEPSIGLGLHLSKKIIEQIGGKLTGFSEGDGKGASFKIIL
ncbi:sensor histidine kinase [Pedobacter arcticus]|uniref:sensor histidine kinase n=1 Tax=Pedobacter arcticus TaxID=752140 RepID=UPI0002DCA652|nr:HAMP domain-containing sensor histidine kinase [Pedobacter arcticus]